MSKLQLKKELQKGHAKGILSAKSVIELEVTFCGNIILNNLGNLTIKYME